jgi:hypothetical protein
MIRVVIDTSTLVSAVISPNGPNAELFDFIAAKHLRPYVTEELLHKRQRVSVTVESWCPGWDLNPHSPCGKRDFKSLASADFATRAH